MINVILCAWFVLNIAYIWALWRMHRQGVSEDILEIPFMYYKKIHMPCVKMLVNGVKLNFIVDSGAGLSVIDEKAVSLMENPKLSTNKLDINGIEGSTMQLQGLRADCELGGRKFTTDFFIKDCGESFKTFEEREGVYIHGLLGCNVLSYNGIVDFNDKKLIFK